MKVDGFIRQVLVLRNKNTERYEPFCVTLVDARPENEIPCWDEVEIVKIYPECTEIFVYDLDRPVYYNLPDGTRRKVHYPKK